MMMDLFAEQQEPQVKLADGAYWLRGFALPVAGVLWATLTRHFETYPPLQMMTPMGYKMSVRTTSFGQYGWVGTAKGYGYATHNQFNQQSWPAIPDAFFDLAQRAALQAGYAQFIPDSCLINVYDIGSKMGLHQDKDELDFSQPIVSVSLGIPATFLFGGTRRGDSLIKIPLSHGDVVLWGGDARLRFHGILPIKAGKHDLLGERRINLTFRKAGKM